PPWQKPKLTIQPQPVNPLKRFQLPVLILTLVFCYGVIGYMVFLRWNFIDALFMVLTTVTTVGYEEVHPLGCAAWNAGLPGFPTTSSSAVTAGWERGSLRNSGRSTRPSLWSRATRS